MIPKTITGGTDANYRSCWIAVIMRAIADYKCNINMVNSLDKATAKIFLNQDWIYELLDMDVKGQEVLDMLDRKSWDDIKKAMQMSSEEDEDIWDG